MKKLTFILLFAHAGLSLPIETTPPCIVKEQTVIEQRQEAYLKEQRIERLMQTFRIIESSDRYDVWGCSGEFGAYQFMPGTWEMYSVLFFGEILDIKEPENQDKVARKKIEILVDSGYADAQIAAFWNSGRTTGWENLSGVNSFGVRFNVPRYVERFLNIKSSNI